MGRHLAQCRDNNTRIRYASQALLVPEPVISLALAHQTGMDHPGAEAVLRARTAAAAGGWRGAGAWLGRLGAPTLAP
jgi:hypothetical protein